MGGGALHLVSDPCGTLLANTLLTEAAVGTDIEHAPNADNKQVG